MAYLVLATFGAVAVTVAGCLLIAARNTGRDARYLGLGALGYACLTGAAIGLILLMR